MSRLFAFLLCLMLLPAGAAEIRLAVGLAKPPYVENGGETGLEAALAIAVLAQAGYQTKVVPVPQARALAMLKEDQVDAMLTLKPAASDQTARLLFGKEVAAAVARAPGYSEHADQDTLNRLLLNRRVDFIVGDEYIFRANPTQTDLNGQRFNIVSYALFNNSPRHVGFASQTLRQQFDAALLKLKASGEYERISQYYRQRYRLPATP